MKTNIKQALRILWNRIEHAYENHAQALCIAVCGLSMGILFAAYVSTFHAARIEPKAEPKPQAIFEDIVLHESPSAPEIPVAMEPLPEAKIDVAPIRAVVPPGKPNPPAETPVIRHAVQRETVSETPHSSSSVASSAASEPHHAAAPEISSTAAEEISSSSSSISSKPARPAGEFPAFGHTSFPVGKIPNWGAMRTPEEWNRPYSEMTPSDFVSIPKYDLSVLQIPMQSLTNPLRDENIPAITAKLFYSTRFFGRYDLDSGEYTGTHAAVDLKLARGTPIGAVAGGRVSYVETDEIFGLHVVIEHRLRSGETYYSIYGHFDRATVSAGEDIVAGQTIGFVGMTGHTTAPHLHLQIDRGERGETHHTPYLPAAIPSPEEGAGHSVNPVAFIARYRSGE